VLVPFMPLRSGGGYFRNQRLERKSSFWPYRRLLGSYSKERSSRTRMCSEAVRMKRWRASREKRRNSIMFWERCWRASLYPERRSARGYERGGKPDRRTSGL